MASQGLASNALPLPEQSWERQVAVALVHDEITASAAAVIASESGRGSQSAPGAAARAAARRKAVFLVVEKKRLRGQSRDSTQQTMKFPPRRAKKGNRPKGFSSAARVRRA